MEYSHSFSFSPSLPLALSPSLPHSLSLSFSLWLCFCLSNKNNLLKKQEALCCCEVVGVPLYSFWCWCCGIAGRGGTHDASIPYRCWLESQHSISDPGFCSRPEGVAEDGCTAWDSSSTYKGDSNVVPEPWLLSSPALAITVILEMNQRMEKSFFLSNSAFQMNKKKIHSFLKRSVVLDQEISDSSLWSPGTWRKLLMFCVPQ